MALRAGHPERAATILREALALWRGSPPADVASESFAQSDIVRLEEQRLAALEAAWRPISARADTPRSSASCSGL